MQLKIQFSVEKNRDGICGHFIIKIFRKPDCPKNQLIIRVYPNLPALQMKLELQIPLKKWTIFYLYYRLNWDI